MQLVKETLSGHEGLEVTMQTSLRGIAEKAARDKTYRFRNLFGISNSEGRGMQARRFVFSRR